MNILSGLPKTPIFRTLFRIGIPSAIDQWLFAMFLLAMFWILGQISTEAAAVGHVVIICTLLLFLPGAGLGMTSLSLVSEALGRKDLKDISNNTLSSRFGDDGKHVYGSHIFRVFSWCRRNTTNHGNEGVISLWNFASRSLHISCAITAWY